MPSNLRTKIKSKSWLIAGLFLVVECLLSTSMAAELATLFSTPQERELINANRYNSGEVMKPEPEQVARPEPIKQSAKKAVIKTFRINGITVANEGPHSVWINDEMYLDGERIDGKSRIKVIAGKDIKVRITAPDGKQYFGTSGESLEIKFLETTDS